MVRYVPRPLASTRLIWGAATNLADIGWTVPIYRLHDTTGDDLGTLEHPAPNVAGDVVVLEDGREALVTARVETDGGQVAALLEVAIAPTPLTSDDGIA